MGDARPGQKDTPERRGDTLRRMSESMEQITSARQAGRLVWRHPLRYTCLD
jgi:hypothetical protein